MFFNNDIYIQPLGICLLFMFFLQSCAREPDVDERSARQFDELHIILPDQLFMSDQFGENYLTHLSYTSVALEDGRVLVGDRELNRLFLISSEGELLDVVARGGRGPGEIQDAIRPRKSADGSILLYDAMNAKLLSFDEQAAFVDEYIFPQHNSGLVNDVYKLSESNYLLAYRSTEHIYNPDAAPETRLILYNKSTGTFGNQLVLPDDPYAPMYFGDQIVGGRKVPFDGGHHLSLNQTNGDIFVMLAHENRITRFNAQLDTVATISFELYPERINEEEKEAIREEDGNEMWQSIEPLLPEYKALADDMKMDSQGNFWLRLNHSSDMQRWLVLSPEGERIAMVHLPEEAMLTHISDHHLGVRMDHHLFGLLEPVRF